MRKTNQKQTKNEPKTNQKQTKKEPIQKQKRIKLKLEKKSFLFQN